MSLLGTFVLLAVDAPGGNALMNQLLGYAPILAICVLFVFMVWRPAQQDAKRKAAQLAALKKNDRVYTSSGIIGTIANISQDGREVTLKVDDNAKIRIFRRSIEGLYTETPSSETGSST
jgi:preprotein translocase subunit YajC